MVKIRCKVKGLENLDKKLNTIINKLPQTTKQGIENAIKGTCEYALHLKKGKKEGILFEMVSTDTQEIKGRVYTDIETFPHSWFLEYGTGIWAEQPHIGTSKTFIESGFEYWFIPVNKVERPLHYPIITIKGSQFYLAHGVQSQPFMRPAEFERRDQNIDEVQKEIYKMLKEVCK